MLFNENLKWINELNQRKNDLKQLLLLKRKDYFKPQLDVENADTLIKE